MRILMLAQFYHPTVGGEEQHVRTLSHALAARGHAVAIATLWRAGLPEFEMDGAVRVYRLRGALSRASFLFTERVRPHAPPFPDPETTWGLRRVIIREQPDIVHAHNWLVHSFLPLKRWSGAKLVVTLHDYSYVCVQKRLMYRDTEPCSGPDLKCVGCAIAHYGAAKGIGTVLGNWAMNRFERRAVDLFLAVSATAARENRLEDSETPYLVIPNFIADDEACGEEAPELAVLPSEDFLMFVGDLVPDKGVTVLVRAYAEMEDAPPLVLIGRRTNETPRALPPNVMLFNPLPHRAVMQAWRRSRIGLLPSLVPETFGLAMLEAMSQERPVIASRIGGLADLVVDGETGLLVTPGEVAPLREAMQHLLTDSELCRRMGRAGKERAADYRSSQVVPRIEKAYEGLTDCEASRQVETCAARSPQVGS